MTKAQGTKRAAAFPYGLRSKKRSEQHDDCSTSITTASAIDTSDHKDATRASATLRAPLQNRHRLTMMLVAHRSTSTCVETTVSVAGGRGNEYCDWWRDQSQDPNNRSLFNIHLIGNASSPQQFTPITQVDLAYCSKWGHNRGLEHCNHETPMALVLPVLSRPEVVEQAVAGVLSGQISLSSLSVEPLLVLANAVGFVSLEATCVAYLCGQAQQMGSKLLHQLIILADSLGLSSLLDAAAEALIKLPWERIMYQLNSLLQLSFYSSDPQKRNQLLHHPQRGAYTELQVLEVLEGLGISRADCASLLDLQGLQLAELHSLLAVLVDREEDSGPLLRAAVQQQLKPEALRPSPDWTKCIRFTDIMLPSPESRIQWIALPHCRLRLSIQWKNKQAGDGLGIYVASSNAKDRLGNIVHCCTVFALHPSKPYVRQSYTISHDACKANSVGSSTGFRSYLSKLQQLYPRGFPGPFVVGVCWQKALDPDKT